MGRQISRGGELDATQWALWRQLRVARPDMFPHLGPALKLVSAKWTIHWWYISFFHESHFLFMLRGPPMWRGSLFCLELEGTGEATVKPFLLEDIWVSYHPVRAEPSVRKGFVIANIAPENLMVFQLVYSAAGHLLVSFLLAFYNSNDRWFYLWTNSQGFHRLLMTVSWDLFVSVNEAMLSSKGPTSVTNRPERVAGRKERKSALQRGVPGESVIFQWFYSKSKKNKNWVSGARPGIPLPRGPFWRVFSGWFWAWIWQDINGSVGLGGSWRACWVNGWWQIRFLCGLQTEDAAGTFQLRGSEIRGVVVMISIFGLHFYNRYGCLQYPWSFFGWTVLNQFIIRLLW